jgi:hypothetical protein
MVLGAAARRASKATRSTLVVSAVLLGAFAGCFGDKAPEKPVAKFEFTALEEIDSFRFDASGSKAESATYAWDFGDKENATGKVVDHTYEYTNGVYRVELCIRDADDDESCVTQDVKVGSDDNQKPEAHFTRSLPRAAVGEPITFDASTSLDKDSDPLTYQWDFNDPIEAADYNAFREAASAGDDDEATGASGGGDADTSPQSARPQGPELPQVPVPTRPSSGDHGPTGPERNVFYTASQTTTAAAITHSYPEPGLYIVRLRAVDIKDESGHDYWPILIEENPPSRSFSPTNETGVTTLGTGGEGQAPAVGDEDPDENFTTVTLPFPAIGFMANLTWTPGQPISESSTQNQLELISTFSDGTVFAAEDGSGANLDGKARIEGFSRLPAGDVRLRILGVNGANIEWTLEVYAKLDTDPFPGGLIVIDGGHT